MKNIFIVTTLSIVCLCLSCKGKQSKHDTAPEVDTTTVTDDITSHDTTASDKSDTLSEDVSSVHEVVNIDKSNSKIDKLLNQYESFVEFSSESIQKIIDGNCSAQRRQMFIEKQKRAEELFDELETLKGKMTEEQQERLMNLNEQLMGDVNRLQQHAQDQYNSMWSD